MKRLFPRKRQEERERAMKGYRVVAARIVRAFARHGDRVRLEDEITDALQEARGVLGRKGAAHAKGCRRRYRERIERGLCGRCGAEPICRERSGSYGTRCLAYLAQVNKRRAA